MTGQEARDPSGYMQMRRAVSRHVLSRPHGIWERLIFPLARAAYQQGYEAGYATGYVTADRRRAQEID